MNRLENILKEKKKQGFTWDMLAEQLPINGNSLRIAFARGNVLNAHLDKLEHILNITSDISNITSNKNVLYDIKDSLTTNQISLIRNAFYVHETELLKDPIIANWLALKLMKLENEIHKEYYHKKNTTQTTN